MSTFIITLLVIGGIVLGECFRWIFQRITRRGPKQGSPGIGENELECGGPAVRLPSYLEGDVQGMHAGQKPVDEDSNDDKRSGLVDAIAAAYREQLKKRYQEPPKPPSTASPRECGAWLQACEARHHAINTELADFMNSRTGDSAEELDRLAAEIDQERN